MTDTEKYINQLAKKHVQIFIDNKMSKEESLHFNQSGIDRLIESGAHLNKEYMDEVVRLIKESDELNWASRKPPSNV